ncbi:hypothetical protein [Desulfosporosinus hippei]|uniref:Uncharacterized protein n=1 Tax=Desulfosporosinus hippei DSM 8344 TaxID=1121419 RepID=A0A1G8HIA6_9FIRM|nr:hypothetical protein [Desulfosporosinus hippei]SDI06404.1 hypothetical protein SAMN05443529_12557 [Desulfosporosinus hippei DSM 8344]
MDTPNVMNKLYTALFIIALTAVFILCGLLLGLIPTIGLPSLGINIMTLGKVQDIADNSGILDFSLDSILYPYGGLVNEGFGIIFIAKLLMFLGISGLNALSITYFILFLISFSSLAILLKKITHNRIIVVLLTAVHFMSPFLMAQSGIPPIFFGVMMLPLSALCDFFLFKAVYEIEQMSHNLVRSDKPALIAWILLFSILVRLVISSIGWYSAVISAVGSCLFFIIYSFFRLNKANIKQLVLRYIVYIIIPWVIGMALILFLTPREAASFRSSMEFFNGNSVDMITLLFPGLSQALANILPSTSYFMGSGNSLTGDVTMWSNYLGYTMMIISLTLIFKKKYRNRITASLAITLLVTLILSLGPGLKVLGTVLQESSPNYSLSLDEVLVFPWSFIYKIFPLSSMRAVYRWLFVPKFVLLILSSVYLSKLYMSGKWQRAVSIILCVLCVVEFLPSRVITGDIFYQSRYYKMALEIKADTIDELQGIVTKENAISALCSYDFDSNGFLVAHIVEGLGIKTYAGAGDKALTLAKGYIPSDVLYLQQTAQPEDLAKYITIVKAKGLCDYVLLPKFALREDSYWWPSTNEVIEKTKKIADTVVELLEKEFTIYQTEHYTVIDLTDRGEEGRYLFSHESILETQSDNVIKEGKILGSEYALNINRKYKVDTTISIPDGDDSMYLLLYHRGLEHEVGELSVSLKLMDGNGSVLKTIEKMIPYGEDYSKYETGFDLGKGVSSVEVTVSNKDIPGCAVKSILFQSYSSGKVFRSNNEQIFEILGFSDVNNAKNVEVTSDEAVFSGDSYIIMTDQQADLGENIEISMDLWLNKDQMDEDDARIITKWNSWQKDMSFTIASKKESIAIIFSSDGTKWEGLFLDKDLIPTERWNNLRIAFNDGLIGIFVNDALVDKKQLTFSKMFVGNTNVEVGENIEGKIKNFHYNAD